MNKIYLYILLIFGIIYFFKNYYKTEKNIILKDHMEGKESENDGGCEKKPMYLFKL